MILWILRELRQKLKIPSASMARTRQSSSSEFTALSITGSCFRLSTSLLLHLSSWFFRPPIGMSKRGSSAASNTRSKRARTGDDPEGTVTDNGIRDDATKSRALAVDPNGGRCLLTMLGVDPQHNHPPGLGLTGAHVVPHATSDDDVSPHIFSSCSFPFMLLLAL
jgi:hypothetical protein